MTDEHFGYKHAASEAHSMYLKYHFHHTESSEAMDENGTATKRVPSFPQFHKVPKTGVIYATSRASVLEQRETGSNKEVGKMISRGKNDESTRVDKTQWKESKMTTQEE